MMTKTIIISLGGSLIAPDGIDIVFLKRFRKVISDFVRRGNRAVMVCGGGNTCRKYQSAARIINGRVDKNDLDWIGIATTRLNAELVRSAFGQLAYEKIIYNPSAAVKTGKKIIIGAGFLPGSSSDKDAVLLAKNFNAGTLINLSNIKYVYDKDPNKFKGAKPYKKISWKEFKKIVGDKWLPGKHTPFDPVASKLAAKIGMELIITRGSDLKNLKNILNGKKFTGTIVH
ncbi:UMP kinase [Candidatus Parcubacteria bacterium]|nr:MAG: UMP kinase [Candidatus Parcubacteria bacterium]